MPKRLLPAAPLAAQFADRLAFRPRAAQRTLALLLVAAAAACDDPSPAPEGGSGATVRLVNGELAAVTVSVDGQRLAGSVAPGAIRTLHVAPGERRVVVESAPGVSASVVVAATATDTPTVVAWQRDGQRSAAVLADTGRLVPPGASKLRVVHMAAGAPPLDVWRTQPDFATPITVAFPFVYGFASAYLQSGPGAWEVRVSRGTGTPDGQPVPGGWDAALARLTVTVPAGQARTVVILDAPDGGVRLAPLDEP